MDLEPTRRPSMSTTTTTHSSPNLGPVTQDSLGGILEDEMMEDITGLSSSFKQHAMRNSKGKLFWETFTDDNSRYGYVYLMKNKSESFDKFKEFKNEVENQLGKRIKTL